jgi:hypothetical protein
LNASTRGITVLFVVVLLAGCFPRQVPGPSSKLEGQIAAAPTVTYCDLLDNSHRYDGSIVRIRGVYSTDFETSEMGSPECNGLHFLSAWVDFDSEYERLTKRTLRQKVKEVKWRQSVDVVFVGKFEAKGGYGHQDMYAWRMVVMSVEQVQPLRQVSFSSGSTKTVMSSKPLQENNRNWASRGRAGVRGVHEALDTTISLWTAPVRTAALTTALLDLCQHRPTVPLPTPWGHAFSAVC